MASHTVSVSELGTLKLIEGQVHRGIGIFEDKIFENGDPAPLGGDEIFVDHYEDRERVGTLEFDINEKERNLLINQLTLVENDVLYSIKSRFLKDVQESISYNDSAVDNITRMLEKIKYKLDLKCRYGIFVLNEKTNEIECKATDDNAMRKISAHRESGSLISKVFRTGQIEVSENFGLPIEKELETGELAPVIILPIRHREPVAVIALAGYNLRKMNKWRFKLLKDSVSKFALIMENIMAMDKLRGIAQHDGMLEVYSRKTIEAKIEGEMKRKKRIALLMIDLDYFKAYNDKHGHVEGDKLLKKFVHVLKRAKRDCDILGRYGGDEFVICSPDNTSTGSKKLAERIIAECRDNFTEVTCSVGVYIWNGVEMDVPALFKMVDEKLYAAKKAGKDTVVIEETKKDESIKKIYTVELFVEFLRKKREERERYGTPYVVLACKGDVYKLLSVVRDSDIIGDIDGKIGIILVNTGKTGLEAVEKRFGEIGVKIDKKEVNA